MSKTIVLEYLRKTNGVATFEEISKTARISMADFKTAVALYQEEISLADDSLSDDILDMIAGGTGSFSRVHSDSDGTADAEG
ncbi:MAG: hypothetical protein HY862_20935 [Chloroflexi bacterium]|nr:hypothetical protein [Chloroflexota bacterium]